MPRGVLLLLLACVVAALLWWMPSPSAPPGPGPSSGPSPSADAEAEAAAGGRKPSDAASASPAARTADRESAPHPDGAEPFALRHVSGRVVAAEDGLPLAGVTVRAVLQEFSEIERFEFQRRTGTAWTAPPPCTTDTEGKFAFSAARDVNITLQLRAVGRAARKHRLYASPEDELGDLPMTRAVISSGVVLDTAGQPVAGLPVALLPENYDHGRVECVSDISGRLTFQTALATEPHQIQLPAPFRDPEPATFTPGTDPELRLVVPTVAPTDWISGRLVDASGGPVAGAVRIAGSKLWRGVPAGTTFVLARDELAAGSDVQIEGTAEGHASVAIRVPWGSRDAVLTLGPPQPPLRLRVVDEAGAPVLWFGVFVAPDRSLGGPRPWIVRAPGHHPGGVLDLPVPMDTGIELFAVGHPDHTVASLARRIEADAPRDEVELVLPSAQPQEVVVVDTKGAPIESVLIHVLRPGTASQPDPNNLGRVTQARLPNPGDWTGGALAIGRTGTDAAGLATVLLPQRTPVWLHLHGQTVVPQVVEVRAAGEPLRLVAQRQVKRTGSLSPPQLVAELHRAYPSPTILAVPPNLLKGEHPRFLNGGQPVRRDGTFSLQVPDDSPFDIVLIGSVFGKGSVADKILLEAGATRATSLDFDRPDLLPGTVRGRVVLPPGIDPALLPEPDPIPSLVRAPDPRFVMVNRGIDVDADLAANSEPFEDLVWPGTYTASAWFTSSLRADGTPFQVAPGQTVEQDFVLRAGTLALTVHDSADRPVPDARILTSAELDTHHILGTTDAAGHLRLTLPARDIQLWAARRPAANADAPTPVVELGTVTITSGQTTTKTLVHR